MAEQRIEKDNDEWMDKQVDNEYFKSLWTNLKILATDVTIAKISEHEKIYFVIIRLGI